MISPKICHCIHPFFREYAPVSTPSSYCIRYSVIKRYSVIVLYKMHIVHWEAIMGGLELDQLSYQEVLKPQWNSQEMRVKVSSLCLSFVLS